MKNKTLLLLIIFLTISSSVLAYGNSEYEYHHIFPRQYFNSLGDNTTIKLKEYEHRWIHNSGGFDKDWEDAVDFVSILPEWIKDPKTELYNDHNIKTYSKRKAAMIAGNRFVSYHFLVYDYDSFKKGGGRKINKPGMLLSFHLDGVSNLLYNLSYITSIPAKTIHFSLEIFKRSTGIFNGRRAKYGLWKGLKMFIWMAISELIGFFSATIMLGIGTIIGTIFHPLETTSGILISITDPFMSNILMSLYDLTLSTIKPFFNILFWTL